MDMPIRKRIWAGVLVSCTLLLGSTGCDDDKEQAAKLAEVQRIADEKLKKAERAAAEKLATLQKQIDSMKADAETQAAKLKSEADQAIGKAQADAEEQTKAAEEALKKARAAYKAQGLNELGQLNKQVQELSVKSAKAPAKVKPLVQKQMKDIVAQQQQIAKDVAAFDKAALDGLGAAKAKLAQDLAKMKATIASIKAKLG
jgi:colicin import membrane protein